MEGSGEEGAGGAAAGARRVGGGGRRVFGLERLVDARHVGGRVLLLLQEKGRGRDALSTCVVGRHATYHKSPRVVGRSPRI